jgi:uncharacterized membrane protein
MARSFVISIIYERSTVGHNTDPAMLYLNCKTADLEPLLRILDVATTVESYTVTPCVTIPGLSNISNKLTREELGISNLYKLK